jgi:hypothetical protein
MMMMSSSVLIILKKNEKETKEDDQRTFTIHEMLFRRGKQMQKKISKVMVKAQ